MCTLKPTTVSVPKQHMIRMRPVQLRIKLLSLRRPESVFLVALTVTTATKYAESCHSWSVLCCTRRFSWRPPFDADYTLSDHSDNTTNLSSSRFHLARHCSEILRSPTSTREHVQSIQMRLNDMTAVPLTADCDNVHTNLQSASSQTLRTRRFRRSPSICDSRALFCQIHPICQLW